MMNLGYRSDRRYLSDHCHLETRIRLGQVRCCASKKDPQAYDPILSRRFDDLLALSQIQVESVTPSQAVLARAAYRDFGKGSGHPAKLNFGDCFSYALAKESGQKLLFKGNDFSETDLESAI